MSYAHPSAYQDIYFHVIAKTPSGANVGPIKIHKYRNTSHSKPETSASAGLALKNKIITALRDRYKKIMGKTHSGNIIDLPATKQSEWFEGLRNRPVDKVAIVRAFSGKGSVEDIRLALDA
ncbi:MAG: hypothetical protein KIT83_20645, partial [Bryobacterales bacterium]|nr:hypothetical protein [Bryobacterales bacterium]